MKSRRNDQGYGAAPYREGLQEKKWERTYRFKSIKITHKAAENTPESSK